MHDNPEEPLHKNGSLKEQILGSELRVLSDVFLLVEGGITFECKARQNSPVGNLRISNIILAAGPEEDRKMMRVRKGNNASKTEIP